MIALSSEDEGSGNGALGQARGAKLLKTGRMFKTLKILRLTKMTKTLKAGMMSEAMEELTTTTTNRSILRFVKLLVITFIVCHWFTCMWVRVGLAETDTDNPSWIK